MNENSEKQPLLSDQQVDDLLSVFYQSEIPAELDRLPSSWTQIANAESDAAVTGAPEPKASPVAAPAQRSGSAGRGFAVLVTALAACVMIVIFSQPASENNTANNKPDVSLDEGDTMTVSGDGATNGSGAAREDDTSWDEVLNSEAPQTPPKKKQDEDSRNK